MGLNADKGKSYKQNTFGFNPQQKVFMIAASDFVLLH